MSFSAVCSAKRISMLTNVSTDSILWKFVILQRATYLNRYQSIINSYGGNQKLALIGTENPTCLQSSIAIASEISVMLDYIRSSPLYQIGLEEDEFVSLYILYILPWFNSNFVARVLQSLMFSVDCFPANNSHNAEFGLQTECRLLCGRIIPDG